MDGLPANVQRRHTCRSTDGYLFGRHFTEVAEQRGLARSSATSDKHVLAGALNEVVHLLLLGRQCHRDHTHILFHEVSQPQVYWESAPRERVDHKLSLYDEDVTISRRDTIMLGVVGVLLIIAAASAVGSLNREIFSAKGFVSSYLHALERHDAVSALSMPGVVPETADLPEGTSLALLRSSALGDISNIRIVDEAAQPDGSTLVSASYDIDSQPATGLFRVSHLDNSFLVFENWAFASPPLGTITVDVLHDTVFDVGSSGLIDLRTTHPKSADAVFGDAGTFVAFAPSSYSFGHTSSLLKADDVTVIVTSPRANVDVTVDVQANAKFTAEVQTEVNAFLDECVTQTVLQPTGCPFGFQTGNRLVGEPTWSVVTYPEVNVVPGETGWVARNAIAKVELKGEIQSLFDGSITPLDEIIDANFNLNITIQPDRGLLISIV
jgi:hypothetical protein